MNAHSGSTHSGLESRLPRDHPRLGWDVGTAYDFFISLFILHDPERFGLRASWAAGVRSRLSLAERKTLEAAQSLFNVPLVWIHQLPEPKDAATVLWTLRQLAPAERLATLIADIEDEVRQVLERIIDQGYWGDSDLESLREAYREAYKKKKHDAPRAKVLAEMLDICANSEEFGEQYLAALQNYHQAFFAEEEKRIAPVLKQGLDEAQKQAQERSPAELMEYLSQGVRIEELLETDELILAPSYWITPFIFTTVTDDQKGILVFGARPASISLVPGELVPDSLLSGLKALADPTRLRILRYLAHEPLTQAELARRLRLRAPTVTHHLNALRIAGLLHLNLKAHEERRYAARLEAIQTVFAHLHEFLATDVDVETASAEAESSDEGPLE